MKRGIPILSAILPLALAQGCTANFPLTVDALLKPGVIAGSSSPTSAPERDPSSPPSSRPATGPTSPASPGSSGTVPTGNPEEPAEPGLRPRDFFFPGPGTIRTVLKGTLTRADGLFPGTYPVGLEILVVSRTETTAELKVTIDQSAAGGTAYDVNRVTLSVLPDGSVQEVSSKGGRSTIGPDIFSGDAVRVDSSSSRTRYFGMTTVQTDTGPYQAAVFQTTAPGSNLTQYRTSAGELVKLEEYSTSASVVYVKSN